LIDICFCKKLNRLIIHSKIYISTILFAGVFLGALPVFAQCVPSVSLGSDITFCAGNSIVVSALDPSCPQATYLWNNGPGTPTITTSSSINITTSGIYYVYVSSGTNTAIDSIRVRVDQPPQIFLGGDQNICVGSSITLGPSRVAGASYNWNTGDTTNTITVSQPGTYSLSVSNSCGTFSDTITIGNDTPPIINLPANTSACSDTTYTIIPLQRNGQLSWSNFSTADTLVVNRSGTYYATATNSCGSITDSITVIFNDGRFLNLGDTIAACPGSPVLLQSNLTQTALNNGSLIWSNNATTPTTTVTGAGIYWAEYTNACGTTRDSVEVVDANVTLNVNLGPDTTVCSNTSYVLDPGVSGTSYLWSTNSTQRTLSVSFSGTYWVQVTNTCGTYSDTVQITVKNAPEPTVPDTISFCVGDSVIARAGPPPNANRSYQWKGGGTGNTKTFSQPGTYWVRRIEGCGIVSKTFRVFRDEPRIPVLDADTLNCVPSKLIFLDSGYFATDSIVWSNGQFNKKDIVVSDTGWYSVQIFNKCGSYEDSIFINYEKPPTEPPLLEYFCVNDSVKIGHDNPQDGVKYFWPATGDTSSFIFVNQAGIYTMEAENFCDSLSFDIEVIEVSQNAFNDILGPDTTACLGDSVILSVGNFPADSVVWHNLTPLPGDTAAFTRFGRTLGNAGRIEVFNRCGVFYDTISIGRDKRPTVSLSDTSLCFGDSVLMSAFSPEATSYLWSNGDTTATTYAKLGGALWVTASNSCYSVTDTALVTLKSALNQIDLGADTVFCTGTLLLDPGLTGNLTYRWQDGSTNSTFLVGLSGTYHVTISDSCGSVSDTINVIITGNPRLILGTEVKYCSSNTLTLNAQNIGSKYLWNTGDTTQTLTIPAPGTYWVTIRNTCDTITDTVDVIIEYPFANYDLGNDTAICPGDSIQLFTGYPDDVTLWQDSSTSPFFTVTQPGTYYCTLSNSCESVTDTIKVDFLTPPVFSLGADTVFCSAGGSVTLTAPQGYSSYLWSNGSPDSSISVSQTGKYWLRVTDFCGLSSTDTIEVGTHNPVDINLGKDTVLCPGESLRLETGITDYDVYWEDGTRKENRLIEEPGLYVATVANQCGSFSDTIEINIIESLEINPSYYELCEGDTVIIDIGNEELFQGSTDGYQISWSDGYTDSVRIITSGGLYELTLRNRCDDYAKTFTVESALCECPVFIPSAFTPNQDGKNDRFKISSACNLKSVDLIIFNRWGQKVYQSYSLLNPWDGNTNGRLAPIGVYTYRMVYEWQVFEETFQAEKIGTVTLIR
jgi:gliding motility-associated-like protein